MAYPPPYPYDPAQQPLPFANEQMPAIPTAVIGPQYCAPYTVDLAVVRKVLIITDGFDVTEVNGSVIFHVMGSLMTIRDRRILMDVNGNPIVTLRRKIMTAHDRWQAFRGESTEAKDLIFSVKRSSFIHFKTKLKVFLANNTKERVCDFKVKGNWMERSCVVYAGESNNIVAEMHKKHTVESILIGKDHFNVTVYPYVDYAFIVALIVILDEINEDEKDD